MDQTPEVDGIVGRGNREGARLFRLWFDGLGAAAEEGGTAPTCS